MVEAISEPLGREQGHRKQSLLRTGSSKMGARIYSNLSLYISCSLVRCENDVMYPTLSERYPPTEAQLITRNQNPAGQPVCSLYSSNAYVRYLTSYRKGHKTTLLRRSCQIDGSCSFEWRLLGGMNDTLQSSHFLITVNMVLVYSLIDRS